MIGVKKFLCYTMSLPFAFCLHSSCEVAEPGL